MWTLLRALDRHADVVTRTLRCVFHATLWGLFGYGFGGIPGAGVGGVIGLFGAITYSYVVKKCLVYAHNQTIGLIARHSNIKDKLSVNDGSFIKNMNDSNIWPFNLIMGADYFFVIIESMFIFFISPSFISSIYQYNENIFNVFFEKNSHFYNILFSEIMNLEKIIYDIEKFGGASAVSFIFMNVTVVVFSAFYTFVLYLFSVSRGWELNWRLVENFAERMDATARRKLLSGAVFCAFAMVFCVLVYINGENILFGPSEIFSSSDFYDTSFSLSLFIFTFSFLFVLSALPLLASTALVPSRKFKAQQQEIKEAQRVKVAPSPVFDKMIKGDQ